MTQDTQEKTSTFNPLASYSAPREEKQQASDINSSQKQTVGCINRSLINMSPYQARQHFEKFALKTLADNIADVGMIQPIPVLENEDGSYTLVAGERRFKAWGIAYPEQMDMPLDCFNVLTGNFDESQLYVMGLIENISREDLNYLELAKGIKNLKETTTWTHEEIAIKLFGSRAEDNLESSKQIISQYLKISSLSESVQNELREVIHSPPIKNDDKPYKFTKTLALLISQLGNEEQQVEAIKQACENGYNKAQLAKYIDSLKPGGSVKKKPGYVIKNETRLSKALTRKLGAAVTVTINKMDGDEIESADIKVKATKENGVFEKFALIFEEGDDTTE